jgi:hypothetical protein
MYADSQPSFKAAYARAVRRYNIEVGKFPGFAKRNDLVVKVKADDHAETDHEVSAESIQNDLEYVVPVKIGTPGVTLHLDFDTGSSDLWVWSSHLANVHSHGGHTIYDPKKSSTAKHATGSWRITYGDGSSASGDVYTDTITIADIVVPRQAVEAAKKLSSSFLTDGGNDGLLGLAWPEINTVHPRPVATPMKNMIEKKLIDHPLFTVKLGRGKEPGFYSFGYIDPKVTSDPLTYTQVDHSHGFWQVNSASYSINDKVFEYPGNTCILDTGTTLALVDDDVLSAIYKEVKGAVYDNQQGGWKFPVGATTPTVAFAVGDKRYTVNPKDFTYCEADTGYLFGGIQSRGNLPFDILGDVFLKSVYVVFNQGDSTVGIAQRND